MSQNCFEQVICGLRDMSKNQNQNDDRKKVILLDEVPASFLFEMQTLDEALDFEWDANTFLVACISPVIDAYESGFKEKLKKVDEKNLLETKNILFKQLDVTYRNSHEIQLFYNVFLAHFYRFSYDDYANDSLTGMMQQPQMNPNISSSSQDGKRTNLPSGPKPTFFITNKQTRELSNDELRILKMKVLEKIRGQDKRLSAICSNSNQIEGECPFCRSMNSQSQNKDDSIPKLVHKGNFFDSSGFRGCEQNNLIIHIGDAFGSTPHLEWFSRARQNLILIISRTQLRRNDPFQYTIKEILTHDQKCKNQKCKENGWDKLKFVDTEYIGLTPEEIFEILDFRF